MKRDVNMHIVSGEVVGDVHFRVEPSGDRVACLQLLSRDGRAPSGDGQFSETTSLHQIVFRGRVADAVHRSVAKGAMVLVRGPVRTRTFIDANEQAVLASEVRAEDYNLLRPAHGGRGS